MPLGRDCLNSTVIVDGNACVTRHCDGSGGCHFEAAAGYNVIDGLSYLNIGWGISSDKRWYAIDEVVDPDDRLVEPDHFIYFSPHDDVRFEGIAGYGDGHLTTRTTISQRPWLWRPTAQS